MTSSTGKLTSHNDCTTEQMGTEPRDLSEKTHQIGSECLDSEQRVLGSMLTNSVIDEKSNQVSANMTENSVIQLPEPPQIGSECLDSEKRVLGTVLTNSVIDEKTNQVSANMTENSVIQLPKPPQIGSECLDSEKRVLGTVLTNSVIGEKTNQVSANMTENSVIQLPELPQIGSECLDSEQRVLGSVLTNSVVDEKSNQVSVNSCQTVEGSCLQQSTFKQVPVNLSDDKSENKCPQNLQNEPGEISDAATGLVVEDQMQSVPVNLSDDKSENKCPQNIQNEPGEIGDAVTGLFVEDQTQSVPVSFSDDKSENKCPQNLQDEPGEISDAVTGLVEDHIQSVPVNFSDDKSENKCPQTLQDEPGEISDAVTGLLVEDKTQSVPVNFSDDKSENKCPQTLQDEPGEISDAVTGLLVEDKTQSVPVNFSDDKSENKCPQNLQIEPGEISGAVTGLVVEDQTQSVPVNFSDDKSENKCPQNLQNEPGEISGAVTGLVVEDQTQSVPVNFSDDKSENICPQNLQNEPGEISDAVTGLVEDQTQSVPVNFSDDKLENKCPQNLQNEPGEISGAVTGLVVEDQMQSIPSQVNMSSVNELLDQPSGDVAKNIGAACSEGKSKSSTHLRLRHRGKSNSKLLKKKYMLRSLGSSDRALRSRTRDKPKDPEPNCNVVDVNNDEMKRKRGRKKKKRRGEGINDQFSKIRAHLRYLLNRVSYEQSLIDAYSGEGWKGYSMEKLKPEKEIQRAKSEILRRKLKIRDLFRNLDSLCAEGRLPESLFDSEGEIDSEDIFCAKCQSKELSTDNDIILCDGACDRGFHQLCLDPPLLTEDIPPGDEGWLCPGCDCKDDCTELVNDSLGTSLSLSDTWERVFPEAATAAGSNMDHNLGLPSDDSDDDDDYNPNGPEDVEVEGGESSSDESEYASASEKLEDLRHEDQYLGLPSEDSEDDDYNPNAPDPDNKVTEESSSSDFTSDSEDLAATIEDNTSTGQDGDLISASLNDVKSFKGSSRRKCKGGKKPSIADELSSLLEPDPGQEDFTPISGRRNVERLDYKKLYDETYQSDTSDDEDWTATATPSRKRELTGKMAPVSPNGNVSNNSRHTPRRNTHHNKVENTNNSPSKSLEGCVESGSSDKKPRSSAYKRLGEAVVQRLHKSFKENQYPDRTTKESLAQELGLTFQQVDKWFGNTRWSFRHSSHTETSPGRNALQQATDSRAENKERECELVSSQEVSGEKSKTPSSRKRKHLSEPQASEAPLDIDGSAIMSPVCSPRADEMQTGKMKTRKRK